MTLHIDQLFLLEMENVFGLLFAKSLSTVDTFDFQLNPLFWISCCLRTYQARSEGGPVPLCPPRHAPPIPHLEPGSNLLNSKLTYTFRFFTFLFNRQCHNLSIL